MPTSHLLMIRPVKFGFNAQTSGNNAFQSVNDRDAQTMAVNEFDEFVQLLRAAGVDITVVSDTPEPHTPDSIFPNNWISFHDDGTIVLYPMYAVNRRQERKQHVLEALNKKFNITATIDLSANEHSSRYLEGTGSMVLDRENKIAYACRSERTNDAVLAEFCAAAGFSAHLFSATDAAGFPIYHTNVMMCMADAYTVICLDSVRDPLERQALTESFRKTRKDLVVITLDQMNHFAGNMLQVSNSAGGPLLIMSSQARASLTPEQVDHLEKFNPILHSSLDTIERNGGGSARCMMAEVFLPLK